MNTNMENDEYKKGIVKAIKELQLETGCSRNAAIGAVLGASIRSTVDDFSDAIGGQLRIEEALKAIVGLLKVIAHGLAEHSEGSLDQVTARRHVAESVKHSLIIAGMTEEEAVAYVQNNISEIRGSVDATGGKIAVINVGGKDLDVGDPAQTDAVVAAMKAEKGIGSHRRAMLN